MKVKGSFITALSGKLGGIVGSHNRGGQYLRALAIPTNPNTPFQQVIRGFMSQLMSLWNNVLTPVQRASWDLYAFNTPAIDVFGDQIKLSGANMYARFNVPYLQADELRQDTAPTIYNLGEFTEPTLAIDQPSNEVDVTFTDTDDWVGEDDAIMSIYASRPLNQTINGFKGPYRFAGKIEGDATTPPTTPAAIALPFPVAADQRVFFKVQVLRADGRLSATFRGTADS